jgi:hypothetical protein
MGRRGVKAGVVVGSVSTLRRRLRTRLALACAQAAEITVRLFGALWLQFLHLCRKFELPSTADWLADHLAQTP